jgi:hypothetical protein
MVMRKEQVCESKQYEAERGEEVAEEVIVAYFNVLLRRPLVRKGNSH